MLPTRFGAKAIGFLSLLFAAFFVSPYSNLFFLQLAFFCVFLAASSLWCCRNLSGLRGQLLAPRPFAAGCDDAVIESDLRTRGRSARAVRLELRLVDGRRVALAESFDLMRRTTSRVEARLPAMTRGVHRVAAARAVSAFPFGLFRAARKLDCDVELAVFPQPIDIQGARGGGLAAAMSALAGTAIVPGQDVVGHLRDWRDGDSLRGVHWRATARRGRPVVKERDGDSGSGVAVVLDRRGQPERVERALAELTTLALAARERAESLEVFSQDQHQRFGESGQPIDDLLRWLAGADLLPAQAPPPPAGPAGALHLPRTSAPSPRGPLVGVTS